MYAEETHQLTADLGWVELWCDRCQDNTTHEFTLQTDNEVIKNRAGKYVDSNRIVSLGASCNGCERERRVL